MFILSIIQNEPKNQECSRKFLRLRLKTRAKSFRFMLFPSSTDAISLGFTLISENIRIKIYSYRRAKKKRLGKSLFISQNFLKISKVCRKIYTIKGIKGISSRSCFLDDTSLRGHIYMCYFFHFILHPILGY